MNWIKHLTKVRWAHSKDKPNMLWIYSFDDEYYYRIKTVKAWVLCGLFTIPYSVKWGVTPEFKRAITRIKENNWSDISKK